MPRKSQTSNVRKICGCSEWKTCRHAWYLDFQRDGVRFRDNLDLLIGWHPVDFPRAEAEARRAIVAKLDGRDPKRLVPSDDPTLALLLTEYGREKLQRDRWQVGRIVATTVGGRRFGDWRVSEITPETLKQFKHVRPLVAGNRDLALLRTAFNWAVLGKLMTSTPFRVGDVVAVSLSREEARTRRLQPGEGERLLAVAGGLHDLITAALETGCRKGELLSLQWSQVRFLPRAELFLPAQKTKAKRDRRIPISTVLAAVLTRRRVDPAGEALPPDAYVFGDAIGRRRGSIKTAWRLTLKRAKIEGLHFHDLRREAGSRWMDAGIPLGTIQRWLGHHNISQTSTYLGASLGNDERDMLAYETKIGRLTPLTQIDVSEDLNRQEQSTSDSATLEKPNKNGVRRDPPMTVH